MSNTITFILVLLAIIITLCGVIYNLARDKKALKEKVNALNTSLNSARINIEQLSSYIDDIRQIKTDEQRISQKIKEAENDEEVYSIISGIIADNNNRVQNNKN